MTGPGADREYPAVRIDDYTTAVLEVAECRVCGQVRHRVYTVEILFDGTAEDNDVAVCARCLSHGWPVSAARDRAVAEALARALPPEGIDVERLLGGAR